MFAGHMYAPRKVKLVDVPEQALQGQGEILFQPELACLCGSDLPYFDGNYQQCRPHVGQSLHEMIGRVVESTGDRFKVGDRVLCVPVDHFGFYERFRVSENRAIPLDPRPSDVEAVLAQPLGTVLFGMQKVPSVLDKDVVVLGQGPIGQLFNATLCNLGARRIIAVDLLQQRLRVSTQMGATHTINAANEDVQQVVQHITGGAMADLVIEAIGHREHRLNDAFHLVGHGGDILLFGLLPDDLGPLPWMTLMAKNASLHTSLAPSFERDFPLAMQWIAEGRIDVTPCITHRLPVDQIQEAFDLFSERRDGAIKVFLDFP